MEGSANLVVMLVFGVMCAMIASSRGRSGIGWFFIGFVFPCFGLIVLLVVPDLRVQDEKDRELRRENRRLREQLKKDRAVSDARFSEAHSRLGAHDRALGLDTATPALASAGAGAPAPASLPAAELEDVQWYYLDEDRSRLGPFSFQDMKRFWRDATIGARTMVWSRSFSDWVHLGQVAGLEDEFRA